MLTLNIAKRLAHHSSMGKNFANRLKSTSKPETTTNQSFREKKKHPFVATSNKEQWSASKATSAEPALLEPVHVGARVQGMDGTDWGTIVGEKTEADLDDRTATKKTMGVKWNVVQEPTPTARVESRVVSGEDLGTPVEQPPQSSWELNELGTTGGITTRDKEVSNLDNSVRSFSDYKKWIRKQSNFDKKRQRQRTRPSKIDKAIRQEFPTFPTNQKERDHQESRRKVLRSEIQYFNSNSTSMQAGLQAQKKRIQVRQELEQAKIASTKHFNKQREPNANQHTTTTQPIQLIQPNEKEDLSFLYRKPSQTKKKLEILTKPTVAEVVVATVAPASPRAPKKLENMKISELKQKANKLGLSKEQVIELAGGSNRRNGKQTRHLWINGIKEHLKNHANLDGYLCKLCKIPGHWMEDCSLFVSGATQAKSSSSGRPRSRTITQMIKEHDVEDAWFLFYDRIESSEMMSVEDCNVMIAACSTSEQQWELIDVTMRNANIKPTVSTFNTHIARLMIEGSYLEAKIVIEEMKAVGIEPDADSTEILSWSESDLSNRRNGQLKQFWLEGGQKATDAAWKLFNCIVERDLANVSTFNSMLILCQNYDQQRELIDVKMVQAGIKPDVSTWHKLLIDKLLRKDPKERKRTTTAAADKFASIGRTNQMKQLLKTDGKEASMKYLQEIISNKKASWIKTTLKADTFNCGWAIKELCDTSDEARAVIHQMDKNNVPIDDSILTLLIYQLLVENKKEEAQHVLDNDFERYGIKTDDFTRKTMANADKLASIGHTNKMKQLLKADAYADSFTAYRIEESMKYFQELISKGKASTINCGWAIKELCYNSDEARAVIHQMDKNNIPITEVILTQLIYELLHEDKQEEAQHVFDNDFKRYGVQPDDITREIIATAGKLAGIKQLLKADGKEVTMKYLQELISNGKASTTHCRWALKELCDTSDEAHAVIRQMNENNVPIDEAILTILIYQLLYFDKQEEAQHVFDYEFERYGLKPNNRTRKTMANADKLASIGRKNKMKSILRADGKKATMKYLIESMHNGKASTTNCGWAMKELCDTSGEARAVIRQMNENNVPITELMLTHLIYHLLREDKKEEAQHVFDNDFKRYGVQPDHIARETMENFNYGITLAYPFDEFLSLASTNAATWRNKLKEMV